LHVATVLTPTHFELPTIQVPVQTPMPRQTVLAGQATAMNPTPLGLHTRAFAALMQVESVGLQATSCLATQDPVMQVDPGWHGCETQVASAAQMRATISFTHSVAPTMHLPLLPLSLLFPQPAAVTATATPISQVAMGPLMAGIRARSGWAVQKWAEVRRLARRASPT
jgi:hypothetical protein